MPLCDAWWDETDSLTRVAGLWRRHVDELTAAGITTLAALARANPAEPPPRLQRRDLRQAPAGRPSSSSTAARPASSATCCCQPQPEHGLALLPDPSPGDLFFDLEGNPFWDEQGSLEYLWGILDTDGALHARSGRTTTRASGAPSSRLVDLIHARLAADPDLHVYHYAAYEITALPPADGPLRHARGGGGRPAPPRRLRRPAQGRPPACAPRVPGYGLKEMEAFLDFTRSAPIRDGGTSIVEYER